MRVQDQDIDAVDREIAKAIEARTAAAKGTQAEFLEAENHLADLRALRAQLYERQLEQEAA